MQDNNYQYNQTEPKQSGTYDCSNGTNSQYYQNAQYNAYYQNGQYQSQYQNNQYYQPQYQQYQNSQYGYATPAQQEYANFENKLSNTRNNFNCYGVCNSVYRYYFRYNRTCQCFRCSY